MSTRGNRTVITEAVADSLMAVESMRLHGGVEPPQWARYAGVHNRAASVVYDVEVEALLRRSPTLKQAVRAACQPNGQGRPTAAGRAHLLEVLELELSRNRDHTLRSLEALLAMDVRSGTDEPTRTGGPTLDAASGRQHPMRHWLSAVARRARRVMVPLIVLNGIVLTALAVGPVLHIFLDTPWPTGDGLALALAGFAVWALSFMPGWLFVRFLDRRASALWDEYVIHLHRMALDSPGNLPEPPRTSDYHAEWANDGGAVRVGMRNVYRAKFDAYYGRSVSRYGSEVDRPVRSDALFPVFLCTAVLTAGWTAVLYDRDISFGGNVVPTLATSLSFGFMGSYLFLGQILMRRYFQADLRASAFVTGYVRIVSSLVVIAVLQVTLFPHVRPEVALAVAFIVGWFPNVGLQWVVRVVSRALRGPVPSLEPAYPLNRLDGLNVWYEARLLEEGIEDLQELATAKIVDVMLHTRVPVARLVDWVDQALLLIHLPPEPTAKEESRRRTEDSEEQVANRREHPRQLLRRCGIRTATGLLRALYRGREAGDVEGLLAWLDSRGLSRAEILSLHDVIAADRRLGVIFSWQEGDSKPPGHLPLDGLTVAEPPGTAAPHAAITGQPVP